MSEISHLSNVKNGIKLGKLKKKDAVLRRKEYYKNPKTCLYCQSPIPYEKRIDNKFCSKKECSSKYYTENIPEITSEIIDGIEMWVRYCPTCNKKIYQTRRNNAIRMFRENRKCRKCSKSNIPTSVKEKKILSYKDTIERIRIDRGYYDKL